MATVSEGLEVFALFLSGRIMLAEIKRLIPLGSSDIIFAW